MADAPKRNLTELAVRYTHPTGRSHKIIAHTGKSGWSPVNVPLHLRASLSQKQHNYVKALESYQRAASHCFTVQDPVALEAFAPHYESWSLEGREDDGIDIDRLNTIPIHQLFSKSKWQKSRLNHIGRIPLGLGRSRYFEVSLTYSYKTMDI